MTPFPTVTPARGRRVLITGASRGIGAETARILAAAGMTVAINYRSKSSRALGIVAGIERAGGTATAIGADITEPADLRSLFEQVRRELGSIDILILNASGGLEAGVTADYAMLLNRDAQMNVVRGAMPMMAPGSRVVFLTSHQAHFFPSAEPLPQYLPVAHSKRAGEDALRALIPELTAAGITFVVVSGDLIEGTSTATLLEIADPEAIAVRRTSGIRLYDVGEFAAEVAAAAVEPIPEDHTRYVGDIHEFTI